MTDSEVIKSSIELMATIRTTDLLRPKGSIRTVSLVFVLAIAVGVSEAPLYFGEIKYTIWGYSLLLVALSLAPLLIESETPVFLAFALIPAFRLVNLAMPTFVELTLLWLPLVYGPFILVFVYLGWRGAVSDSEPSQPNEQFDTDGGTEVRYPVETQGIGHELPWWLGGNRGGKLRSLLRRIRQFLVPPEKEVATSRLLFHWLTRGFIVALLPIVAVVFLISLFLLTVYLAEFEYSLIAPSPLISSLGVSELTLLVVVMIGFVGVVEEFIFRGILQKVLERRLGIVLGLLLTSGIYGLMHSIYGEPNVILFAAGVGLLLGIMYDVTESLVLVSVMHGLQNVFLFGIIPLEGVSSIELLETILNRDLQRAGVTWLVDTLHALDFWWLII